MSVDPVGNLDSQVPPVAEQPKRRRSKGVRELTDVTVGPKVRKHLLTTAYKQDVAEKLDKLYASNHTIVSITSSPDIRGFEIVSYNEE